MPKTTLHRMLNEVKSLTPDEQRQLREAIDRLLSAVSAPPTEEEFEQELVEAGILDEIPPLPAGDRPNTDWKPIEIRGKPLSETIVEERR